MGRIGKKLPSNYHSRTSQGVSRPSPPLQILAVATEEDLDAAAG
jgi:hypothetical protein